LGKNQPEREMGGEKNINHGTEQKGGVGGRGFALPKVVIAKALPTRERKSSNVVQDSMRSGEIKGEESNLCRTQRH